MSTRKQSAGILMFRRCGPAPEVFLVHPGGPFWARKNEGAWTIPKGEFTDESPLKAAKREFTEETGFAPEGNFIELTPIKQPGGKWVHAWAVEGNCDAAQICSNTFTLEWPPRSGKLKTFPEIDRAEWFPIATAEKMILRGQLPLLQQLHREIL